MAPAFVCSQVLIQNAAAVLFPAWVPLGNERPRGVDALGQRERALQFLQKAYDNRGSNLPRQWKSPMLSDGMKSDPRFQELIRRTGNPWARLGPAAQRVAEANPTPGERSRP